MTWFLVLITVAYTSPGIMPTQNDAAFWALGQSSQRIEIHMPSHEVCEQIAKLNDGAQCWAKAETSK